LALRIVTKARIPRNKLAATNLAFYPLMTS